MGKEMTRIIKSCFLVIISLLISIPAFAAEPFELHLIDVGQGQSVLIEADNHYMLIDGGGRISSSYVVAYLKQQGVNHLDYAAVSHYDEDHMSGLIGALSVFACDGILVPPYPGDGDLYKSFATAAVSNGGIVFHPECDWTFQLGNAVVEVVGPMSSQYENDNDESLVFRITYGNTAYLITGDAEQQSEMDMINSGKPMTADVYVAGHHGSRSSSTDPFLDSVSPVYGLISCGTGNTYGHPAMETLQRFRQRGIKMFRTDLQGTVIVFSDGDTIWFSTEACDDWTAGSAAESEKTSRLTPGMDETSVSETVEDIYICNTNTKKFHLPTCRSVGEIKPENRMDSDLSRDELIAEGYRPCKNCNP